MSVGQRVRVRWWGKSAREEGREEERGKVFRGRKEGCNTSYREHIIWRTHYIEKKC